MNGNTPNADEIVKALRICNNPKGHRCSECPVFSKYDHRVCKATVDRQAASLIESQAAEILRLTQERDDAQRRADAAVADMRSLDVRCRLCKHSWRNGATKQCSKTPAETAGGKCFEWRGTQEATHE